VLRPIGRGPSASAHPWIQEKEDIVSPAERFVRHHHRQTDRAMTDAYRRLAADPPARASFTELLDAVRRLAPQLLAAPIEDGRHPGIEALVQLARAADRHIRPASAWGGSRSSWRRAVHDLALHLVGVYAVPVFLGSAWYAVGGPFDEAQRRWFVAHARGRPFRSLDLPIAMTRRMEHLFLRSPAHFGVAYAMRHAELLGLGAEPAFANVILTARASLDLEHGAFWRTAWRFLIAHAGAIDRAQVAPMIDFFHGIRHERIEVETPAGIELRDPPDPGFSLEGRTVASVLRLMEAWHRGLGLGASRLEWAPSGLRPMTVETPPEEPGAPPTRWELVELTSAALLRAEGAALKHCVASYGRRCVTGDSRIWSLRRRREGDATPVLTIEVDPRRKAVVQVRGLYNRAPIGRSWQIVQTWARREQLRLVL
jgi:PcfJ-like protein